MPPIKGKMYDYSEDDMIRAYNDAKSGSSISAASKKYNVPYSTLAYKLAGKTPLERRRQGPKSILSDEQENILVIWIKDMAKAGFPVTVSQLQDSVSKLIVELQIENPFTNNRPGKRWNKSFQNRHPEISLRTTQNLTESRAAVTAEALAKWFAEVMKYLSDNNLKTVLENPQRVFNCDESAFFLNPKGNKVLAAKGDKTIYQKVNADEKECLTVLVTGNAAGDVPPPMIVFQYERIPRELAASIPENWGVGRSENGWMTGETFFEFIANIFNPWLIENQIEKPVLLFIDGHTSHLTLQTSKFCSDNDIVLVALYPNATHILQPMDVSVFRSLKLAWKTGVQNWRLENLENPKLRKVHFSPLLKKVLDTTLKKSLFENGFRTCGLCPWNPEAVLQKYNNKKDKNYDITEKNKNSLRELREGFEFIEKHIDKQKLQMFRRSQEWTGDFEDKSLFEFWKKIKTNYNEAQQLICVSGQEVHEQINEENCEVNSFVELDSITLAASEALLSNAGETRDFLNASEVRDILTNLEVTTNNVTPAKTLENESAIEKNARCFSVPDINVEPKPSTSSTEQIIPTPFKRVLFWPKEKQNHTKKRKTEKIPSVITSKQWQEYYDSKEKKKREEIELKQKRAEERKKKKEEKEQAIKLKNKNIVTVKNKKSKNIYKVTKVLFDSNGESEDLIANHEARKLNTEEKNDVIIDENIEMVATKKNKKSNNIVKKATKISFDSDSSSELENWQPSAGSTDELKSDSTDDGDFYNIF